MLPCPEIITIGRVDAALAQPRQRGQAVDAGQPDVEDDDVVRRAHDAIEAGLARLDRLDGVALVAQHAAQRARTPASSSTMRMEGFIGCFAVGTVG